MICRAAHDGKSKSSEQHKKNSPVFFIDNHAVRSDACWIKSSLVSQQQRQAFLFSLKNKSATLYHPFRL